MHALFISLYFFVTHKCIFYDQRPSKEEHIFKESSDCFPKDPMFHAWVLDLAQKNCESTKALTSDNCLLLFWFVPDDSQGSSLVQNGWALLEKFGVHTLHCVTSFNIFTSFLLMFAYINDIWEAAQTSLEVTLTELIAINKNRSDNGHLCCSLFHVHYLDDILIADVDDSTYRRGWLHLASEIQWNFYCIQHYHTITVVVCTLSQIRNIGCWCFVQ